MSDFKQAHRMANLVSTGLLHEIDPESNTLDIVGVLEGKDGDSICFEDGSIFLIHKSNEACVYETMADLANHCLSHIENDNPTAADKILSCLPPKYGFSMKLAVAAKKARATEGITYIDISDLPEDMDLGMVLKTLGIE